MSDIDAGQVEISVPDADDWEMPDPNVSPAPEEEEAAPKPAASTAEVAAAKRYRATKAEMENREKAALRLLQQSPMTINKLSTVTNLPYPKAATMVQRLVTEGRVTAIGQDNGRTLYKLDPKVAVKPVRQLPNVSFANFLDRFHLGQELKVVGLHITETGTVVEVQVDGQVIGMQTTG